jgi:hypothetical protein
VWVCSNVLTVFSQLVLALEAGLQVIVEQLLCWCTSTGADRANDGLQWIVACTQQHGTGWRGSPLVHNFSLNR